MIGIALGAASFCIVFWIDALAVRGIRSAQPIVWLCGIATFVAGLILCLNSAHRAMISPPLRAVGFVFAAAFVVLLVYSLFIEIPFLGQPSRVVSRGTYALCRHPGVLWLGGFLISLFLSSGSWRLLLAIPVWMALDVLWVVLQEKLFFMRIFGAEYEAYQREVPMLIPSSQSIRECARTIFRRDT
jgi:protein-S-isoprenylcysteine O-methyltransferase Ste14